MVMPISNLIPPPSDIVEGSVISSNKFSFVNSYIEDSDIVNAGAIYSSVNLPVYVNWDTGSSANQELIYVEKSETGLIYFWIYDKGNAFLRVFRADDYNTLTLVAQKSLTSYNKIQLLEYSNKMIIFNLSNTNVTYTIDKYTLANVSSVTFSNLQDLNTSMTGNYIMLGSSPSGSNYTCNFSIYRISNTGIISSVGSSTYNKLTTAAITGFAINDSGNFFVLSPIMWAFDTYRNDIDMKLYKTVGSSPVFYKVCQAVSTSDYSYTTYGLPTNLVPIYDGSLIVLPLTYLSRGSYNSWVQYCAIYALEVNSSLSSVTGKGSVNVGYQSVNSNPSYVEYPLTNYNSYLVKRSNRKYLLHNGVMQYISFGADSYILENVGSSGYSSKAIINPSYFTTITNGSASYFPHLTSFVETDFGIFYIQGRYIGMYIHNPKNIKIL